MTTKNTKILLITNDDAISQSITDIASENSWKLIETSDVKQAEQLLLSAKNNDENPDIVLISNPRNGHRQEATKAIKDGIFLDIPTILFLDDGQKLYGATKKKIAGKIKINKISLPDSPIIDPEQVKQVVENILQPDGESADKHGDNNISETSPDFVRKIIEQRKESPDNKKQTFTDRVLNKESGKSSLSPRLD